MNAPKRYPCGKRRPAVVTGLEDQRPVLEKRCALMGWPLTDAYLLKARDQDFGTPWGLMHLTGALTEHEKLAAAAFAALHKSQLRAIDAPPPHPKAPFTEYVPEIKACEGVEVIDDPEERSARARARYAEAENQLRSAGQDVLALVKELCANERQVMNLPTLKRGLAVLVEFFGIENVRPGGVGTRPEQDYWRA